MRTKTFFVLGLAFLALMSCESKERVKAPAKTNQEAAVSPRMPSGGHQIIVKEVIQARSYTYLKVDEAGDEYWIATVKQDVEAGAKLSYDQGLEMKNFTSKELDRTFDSIWFVSQFEGTEKPPTQASGSVSPHGQQQSRQADIQVEKLTDGVSVADLYGNPAEYAGKTVGIRGQVTKFNPNIMGRNWVHIQDGTRHGESFDLTITTMADVHPGDVVVFRGIIHTNKDFGAGYFYDLIMEDAELVRE